jgi:hypothetical protein
MRACERAPALPRRGPVPAAPPPGHLIHLLQIHELLGLQARLLGPAAALAAVGAGLGAAAGLDGQQGAALDLQPRAGAQQAPSVRWATAAAGGWQWECGVQWAVGQAGAGGDGRRGVVGGRWDAVCASLGRGGAPACWPRTRRLAQGHAPLTMLGSLCILCTWAALNTRSTSGVLYTSVTSSRLQCAAPSVQSAMSMRRPQRVRDRHGARSRQPGSLDVRPVGANHAQLLPPARHVHAGLRGLRLGRCGAAGAGDMPPRSIASAQQALS